MISDSLFIRVNEIHKGPDVVAVRQAGLLLSHFQPRVTGIVGGGWVGKHPLGMSTFLRIGSPDIAVHPVGHLAIRDRALDHFDQLLMAQPGGLEPALVESFAQIGLVIRMKPPGQVQPDLVDVTGQMRPSAHGLTGASRIDHLTHLAIVPGGIPFINFKFPFPESALHACGNVRAGESGR